MRDSYHINVATVQFLFRITVQSIDFLPVYIMIKRLCLSFFFLTSNYFPNGFVTI